jgi:hypothetical protein
MQQERELTRPSNDVVVRMPPTASVRRARGTHPPRSTISDTYTVECKRCKSRIPFATAIILGTHYLCTNCSFADTRTALVPKNAENTHLPHQLGGTLFALLVTVVLTAGLIVFYSV